MNAFLISLAILFNTATAKEVSDTTLVNALKTLYKLEGASSIQPKDQQMIRQLAKLKQVNGTPFASLKKIDDYMFKGKPNKENIKPYIQFQIWRFDNSTKAKQCFDEMKKWGDDKPPKAFFQYDKKIYYFAAGSTYIYLEYGRKAYNKVVSFFNKAEIQQVVY